MMERKHELALYTLEYTPCAGVMCDEEYPDEVLRYGRETVGRGMGFYCHVCFQEHCPGKSWEDAPSLRTCRVEATDNHKGGWGWT